jgi:hypothetical protein
MDKNFNWIDHDPRILAAKARYARNAKQILNVTVDDTAVQTRQLVLSGCLSFVICGGTSPRKTRSVEIANRQLNPDKTINLIAECKDFATCDDVEKIEREMKSITFAQRDYKFMAFSIMYRKMGELLAARNSDLRVIFIE